MSWNCEICNVSLKPTSKYGHLKTKKHLKNLSLLENEEKKDDVRQQQVECIICCNNSTQFMNCVKCDQKWCQTCDNKVFECPYCRHPIRGREVDLKLRKRENFIWYITGREDRNQSDEDFVRTFLLSSVRRR